MTKNFVIPLILVLAISTAQAVETGTNGKDFCEGCRSIVSFFSQFNSTSQRADNKELFKTFCEQYYPVSTDFRQGPCPWFAEAVFYVIDQVDPVSHCDQIGACNPNYQDESVDVNESAPVKNGGVVCDVCEQVITQAQGLLEDPDFVASLRNDVNSFCQYLTVIGQSQACKQMVNNYVDQAIDFVRGMKPIKFCQSISACSQTSKFNLTGVDPIVLARYRGFGLESKVIIDEPSQSIVVKDQVNPAENSKVSPNCTLCKMLVKDVFKFLKGNRTETNIRKVLDQICTLAYKNNPSKHDHCIALMNTYSKELMEIILDETDPDLVCVLLEQCTYSKPTKQTQDVDLSQLISLLDPSIPLNSMRSCVECKMFIQYILNVIEDPKSENHVKEWLLANLCGSIEEDSLKQSCISMVNNYSLPFFQALTKELNPKQACIDLHACKAKPRILVLESQTAPPDTEMQAYSNVQSTIVDGPAVKNQICDQCVDIVTQIDQYLASHPIDHDLSDLIDKVCGPMPESVKGECTFLIKTFGQDIAQAISTMDNPRQLCQKIMLCSIHHRFID